MWKLWSWDSLHALQVDQQSKNFFSLQVGWSESPDLVAVCSVLYYWEGIYVLQFFRFLSSQTCGFLVVSWGMSRTLPPGGRVLIQRKLPWNSWDRINNRVRINLWILYKKNWKDSQIHLQNFAHLDIIPILQGKKLTCQNSHRDVSILFQEGPSWWYGTLWLPWEP